MGKDTAYSSKQKSTKKILQFKVFLHHTQGHPNIKKNHKGSTSIAKITYTASHRDRGVTQHSTLASRQVIQIKTKERNAVVK